MTTLEEALVEILITIPKLTTNKEQAMNIFKSAGIIIDDKFLLVALTGDAESCVKTLLDKLSSMPVIKISAKRILRSLPLTA